ncbi:3,4-dihydroxy-2-butanone-4-phosphate synthase [Roseibium sp. RKSG952]|uniref:3,4-dihydroxy-2-butanone-4-phosphate synthase n=1 Tax=Roseibium sp. RKSG952 TaxID=2529384 RepID=UPI0012BC65CE|nr:3,4-dihydroxy-2-butanone-4-phosphate synthase [Roseibium sp. RKSG952]MTI02929.1 3,4-dihydroxy-2-butanone-4-phosphate synthase [Roseibium sp. RKSG952]
MFDLHEVYRLSPIEDIIADCALGRMVILVDDESRENEGDLVIPATCADVVAVNFMARFGRGLICMAISPERAQQFSLGPMAALNTDPHHTAFTISVDAKEGTTTGISASDRARTIALLASNDGSAADLVSPGHMFPLVAKSGGVLEREGHTEAAVDLARLSGQGDAGVICEIMKDNGEMARLPDLLEFGARHGLKVGTIEGLRRYRQGLPASKAA